MKLAAALALALSSLGVAAARAADPADPANPATVTCTDASWVAGSVDLCSGELVYRDYVYDDYGADTGAYTTRAGTTASVGDISYPAGATLNSADLLTLRLRVDGDRLDVRFQLNTMLKPDEATAVLAIDTDGSGEGELRPWPGVAVVASRGWDVAEVFTAGDPSTNVIEGSIPLPAGDTWRVQAAVAQRNGTVMNVAFRGIDEKQLWYDDLQAKALRTGDISAFGHTVAVADLHAGVTRAAPLTSGLHERVYESAYTIDPTKPVAPPGPLGGNGTCPTCPVGEGMVYGNVVRGRGPFAHFYNFFGRHQPYSVYVPGAPGTLAPRGMAGQLFLHGLGGNHSGTINQVGFQRDFGSDRIIVSPLGRGPQGYYHDASERDVLDALEDAITTYGIDRDRVIATGYSMGGYGTLWMSSLHPDLFAGYAQWSGGSGDSANPVPVRTLVPPANSGGLANIGELFRNHRYVPGASLYASADYLVTANQQVTIQNYLRAAGNPYVFYQHPAAEHLTFGLIDQWAKEANYLRGRERATNPARVTYRTDGFFDDPLYDVSHDGAYWISGLTAREPGTIETPHYTDVDLLNHGCGGTTDVVTADPPGAGPSPVPWVSESARVTGTEQVAVERRVTGSVANASALTLDVDRMCLAGGPVTLEITTDGPMVVRLSDGGSVVLDGAGSHAVVLEAV